jgi:hypothetical protein
MRFLSTRVHGAIDYLTRALLIVSPWLFGFADGGAAQWVPVVLGAGIVLLSLLTAYEWGAVKAVPMPVHLGIDLASGLLLAVLPWLFGFAALVWLPHVLVGLFEIAVSLVTRTVPGAGAERQAHGNAA